MMTLNDIRMNKKLNNNPVERLDFLKNWLKKQFMTKYIKE